MWRTQITKQELVTVTIENEALSLSVLQRNKNNIFLCAYKKIPILNYEVVDGIIYNIEFIKKSVCDFISIYKLHNPSLALCIHAEVLHEQFYKTTHHDETEALSKLFHNMAWDEQYLCPSIDHDGFWHYACGMYREHLFHYSLLALELGYPLSLLTSYNIAYLFLYKYRYADCFRQSQLSLDLATCNFDPAALFSPDGVARCMGIKTGLTISWPDDYKTLGASLGLFLAGEHLI
jgi:hypothetical protein